MFIAAAIAEGFRVRRINDSNPNAWFNISSAAWGALMTTNEGERLCRVAKMPGGYTVTFSCRVLIGRIEVIAPSK